MTEQSSVNRPQKQASQQMPDDEIDLRHLLALLIDGRYIITTVTAVVTMLALIYVFLATSKKFPHQY